MCNSKGKHQVCKVTSESSKAEKHMEHQVQGNKQLHQANKKTNKNKSARIKTTTK
jgi:hypothetical protein